MEHVDEQGSPSGQPHQGGSPWRAPGQDGQQQPVDPAPAWRSAATQPLQTPQPYAAPQPAYGPPATPSQPQPQPWEQGQPYAAPQPGHGPLPQPAPWLAQPQGNPVAVWSWVVAVPCAVLGLVLGILGLVRARRRGGAGLAHAVVGTVLSAVVLLVGSVGLAVGAAAALAELADGSAGSDRSADGTVASLSAPEQAYIDDLYEETYQAFDDATLLDMAYGFCSDLDAGQTPAEADAALVSRWADEDLDLNAAYDVEWSATASLCPEHADEFQAWDPASTDGSGTTTTTTTTSTTTTVAARR